MSAEVQSSNERLKDLIEALQQESNAILVLGRTLTDEEKRRVDQIEAALPLLRQALTELQS